MDLCENVHKPQWQAVAKLLKEWKDIEKVQVRNKKGKYISLGGFLGGW